jgi:ribosomal protein L32
VEGLDDQIQWPDHNRRRELANMFQGVMKGCIGIADVKEYQIEKPTDKIKERESFGGKKKINSYRMLSVCDHTGRYIVHHCICRKGFFSEDEFVASDGGFEGDGRF